MNWTIDAIDVHIPGHPEMRFYPDDPRYEIMLSPYNGYDDGELHEDRLEFVVQILEASFFDDDHNEYVDPEPIWSRRTPSPMKAQCFVLEAATTLLEDIIPEAGAYRAA